MSPAPDVLPLATLTEGLPAKSAKPVRPFGWSAIKPWRFQTGPRIFSGVRIGMRSRSLVRTWAALVVMGGGLSFVLPSDLPAASEGAFRLSRAKTNERIDGLASLGNGGWGECGIQREPLTAGPGSDGESLLLSRWYVRGLDKDLKTQWEHSGDVRGINRGLGIFPLPEGRFVVALVEGLLKTNQGSKSAVDQRLVLLTLSGTGKILSRTEYQMGVGEGLIQACELFGEDIIVVFGAGKVGNTELGTGVTNAYSGPYAVGIEPANNGVRFLVGTNLGTGLQFGMHPFRRGGEVVVSAWERPPNADGRAGRTATGRPAATSSVLKIRHSEAGVVLTKDQILMPGLFMGLAWPTPGGEMLLSWRDEARFGPELVVMVSQPQGWLIGNAGFLGVIGKDGQRRWVKEFSGGIAAVRNVIDGPEGGAYVLVESGGNRTALAGEILPAASGRRLNIIGFDRNGVIKSKWIICGAEENLVQSPKRCFVRQGNRILVSLELSGEVVTGLPGQTEKVKLPKHSSVLFEAEVE